VPTPTITATRARFAASMAEALVKHETQHQHGRFVRTLRTFREACETYHLDQRLHQFVRALEGFTAPPFRNSRVHFAERIKRICAGPASRHLLEMYTIRSGIEHLHGPYDRLRKFSDREKWQRLVVRCVEAEVVARYMISTYLSNQQLWPHFESRESIDAFWHLKPAAFRMLWRTRIHFPTIAKGIEHRTLEREYSKEFARG